ncbi:MAG TPA: DinB family protein [Gemmatimonadaceae bacterium]
MRSFSRLSVSLVMLLAACKAQNAAPPTESATPGGSNASVATDLLNDLTQVETKLVDLAGAIPEGKYGWHPDSARTVRQVLLHVAADNYVLPAMLGFTPDPSTGITSDYKTGAAFEARDIPKDSVIADLKKSFAFVKQSLQAATPASLVAPVTMFGQQFTGQSGWILTVTHLHEHLGQMIAYARTNGVKPPWS